MVRKRRRSKAKEGIDQEQVKSPEVQPQESLDKARTEEKSAKTTTAKTAFRKKETAGGRFGVFLKEVRAEIKKVSWPDRERTTNSTLVVIFTLVVLAICMTLFTILFTRLADYFFKIPTTVG